MIEEGSRPRRSETDLFRLCAMCDKWKPLEGVHRSRTGQLSYCRSCRNEYDRRYYHEGGKVARRQRQKARVENARAWMADLKRGIRCADCGGTFPSAVMHWDHLPGHEKVGEISCLVQERSRTLVLAELAKCELVCANCHAIRTSRRTGV